MWRVFKYEFQPNSVKDSVDLSLVNVPCQRKLLSVQCQNDKVCAWFEVNPDSPPKPFAFYSTGTGHGIIPEAKFFATVQQGPYVWHIYVKEEL